MNNSLKVIAGEAIERRICVIRGHKVMLDHDLAKLYSVTPSALNQAVTRNTDRFPEDFCFRLTPDEYDALRSQNVILKPGGRGQHRKYPPRAFTEHGILMLSSVLRSKRAVQVNIAIMRTFVRMREAMASHKELARRIDEIEQKYDDRFKAVFDAIRTLIEAPPAPPKRPIGYIWPKEERE